MSWKLWLCIILGGIGAPVAVHIATDPNLTGWCKAQATNGGRCGDTLSGKGYFSGGGFGN